ncbi:MAG TPA: hypothetical protein VJH34_00900 [archaeon]|nr:hypothetical protein [archaeon]
MGFLRGIAKGFVSGLFSTSLMAFLLIGNLIVFTEYDNMKNLFTKIATKILPEQSESIPSLTPSQLDDVRSGLNALCQGKESIDLSQFAQELNVQNIPDNLTLKCSSLDEILPPNATTVNTTTLAVNAIFDSIYYKKYDCSFINCMLNAKSPSDFTIIMSEQFNQFLVGMKSYFLGLTGVFLILLLIVAKGIGGKIRAVGWAMFWIGIIPYLFTFVNDYLIARFVPLPEGIDIDLNSIVNPLVESLFKGFNVVFIISIILIVIGYSLGFILTMLKITNKFDEKKETKPAKKEDDKKKS